MRLRFLLLPFALLLVGCRSEGPEAQVRKAFAEAVAAVEAGNAGKAAQVLGATWNLRGNGRTTSSPGRLLRKTASSAR